MNNHPPAGFFLRLVASLIDPVLLFYLPISLFVLSISKNNSLKTIFPGLVALAIFIVFFFLLNMLYTVSFTYYFGGNIGKLLTGLRVRNQTGSKLEFKKILFRQLLAYRFSSLVFGLGYLSVLKDAKKQAWHDKTVDSNVFKVQPLAPLGILVLLVSFFVNGYLLKLSYDNFLKSPVKQEVLGLIADFKQQNKQNTLPEIVSKEMLDTQKKVYALVDAKKYDEASSSAQEMLKKSSNNAEKAFSYQILGEVALTAGKTDIAKNFFMESLKYSTELPYVYSGLSSVSIKKKDYPNAEEYINKSLKLLPNNADSYYRLAVIKFLEGDKEQAVQNLEKAAQLDPTNNLYKSELEKAKINSQVVPTPTAQSSTPAKPSGLGYTIQDAQNLINDLNQSDKDLQVIQTYKGISNYNQKTIDRTIELIPQRKALAQKLLNKMGKGESLTQADFAIWDQYDALSSEQYNLVGTLYHDGGF